MLLEKKPNLNKLLFTVFESRCSFSLISVWNINVYLRSIYSHDVCHCAFKIICIIISCFHFCTTLLLSHPCPHTVPAILFSGSLIKSNTKLVAFIFGFQIWLISVVDVKEQIVEYFVWFCGGQIVPSDTCLWGSSTICYIWFIILRCDVTLSSRTSRPMQSWPRSWASLQILETSPPVRAAKVTTFWPWWTACDISPRDLVSAMFYCRTSVCCQIQFRNPSYLGSVVWMWAVLCAGCQIQLLVDEKECGDLSLNMCKVPVCIL